MSTEKYLKLLGKTSALGTTRGALEATRGTPHDTSRLLQTMSTWSVKTRRAPFRQCSNARFNDHSTTAMHDMSTPPPHLVQRPSASKTASTYVEESLPS